jgi:dTDP-4-dehydrorhamnose reductase
MDRLLVTGGSGLLGSNVANLASARFETRFTFNANRVNIKKCKGVKVDLRDRRSIEAVIRDFKPHVIIHTAALLGKQCDEHPALAQSINVNGTRYLAESAKEVGAKLIHISTDWIFDGKKELNCEEDEPNPLNEYGRTKMKGEEAIRESGANHCIIRTSLYGWNLRVGKLSYQERLLDSLEKCVVFYAPDDQFYNPILVNILAEALFEIYGKDIKRTLNVASAEICSRYRFCRTMAEVFDLNDDLVKPIPISPEYFGVPVPKHQSLDVAEARALLETRLPSIRDGLLEMKHLLETGYVARLRGKD